MRKKRNLSYIQDRMIFKKKISKWQQYWWFKSINNKYNYYYLIEHEGKLIGLINGKDVDYDKMSMEGGIFLWDAEYWNTQIPVIASVIMSDCNFLLSKFKLNYAKILKNNPKAIQYNLNLGYKIVEERKDGVVIMQLTQENYLKKAEKIRRGIALLTVDKMPLSAKDFSLKDESKKDMKHLYSDLPPDITNLINEINKNGR